MIARLGPVFDSLLCVSVSAPEYVSKAGVVLGAERVHFKWSAGASSFSPAPVELRAYPSQHAFVGYLCAAIAPSFSCCRGILKIFS
jgi:hypothetical protein